MKYQRIEPRRGSWKVGPPWGFTILLLALLGGVGETAENTAPTVAPADQKASEDNSFTLDGYVVGLDRWHVHILDFQRSTVYPFNFQEETQFQWIGHPADIRILQPGQPVTIRGHREKGVFLADIINGVEAPRLEPNVPSEWVQFGGIIDRVSRTDGTVLMATGEGFIPVVVDRGTNFVRVGQNSNRFPFLAPLHYRSFQAPQPGHYATITGRWLPNGMVYAVQFTALR